MNKSIQKKIEDLYSSEKEEEVLKLLEDLPTWGKAEYGEYARTLNNLGRYQEALDFLQKEEAKDEKDELWNYRVCYAHFFLQNWEEAIYYAKKALALTKDNHKKIRYFIMESYLEQKKMEDLIAFLDEEALPEDGDWNSYHGTCYLGTRDEKKAIPYFQKAIEIFENTGKTFELEAISKILTQIYFDHDMQVEYEEMKKKYGYPDSIFDVAAYSLEEEDLILAHIEKHFGKVERRIHDFSPEFIDVDILVIPATTNHPYTTLMTLGMGSRFMEGTPSELIPEKFGYDELFLCLPDDWDFSEGNLWPIQYLFDLAKFPFLNQTWIGAGHSLSYDTYIGDTNFSGFLITYPYEYGMESFQFELEEDYVIHFYNILPLYTEELNYKQEIGFEELEELFPESPMVTNIHRDNVALFQENSFAEAEEEEDFDSQQILYQ